MIKPTKQQKKFTLSYIFPGVLLVYILHGLMAAAQPKQVTYNEFLDKLRTGAIKEVSLSQSEFVASLKEAYANKRNELIRTTRLPGIDEKAIVQDLLNQNVKFSGKIVQRTWWMEILSWALPFLFIFGLWGFIFRKMGQAGAGALTFGKNKAKIYDQSSELKVRFKDVAGIEEAKAELVEIVDFLRNPQKYQRLGGRIPKGVLLVGPPGTGKTLLAKAVAGEAQVHFFSISGSEFIEMFVGLGAARMRDLFQQAKTKAPCIIFIDELDAIGKSRASGRGAFGGHDEREQTLNQLLVEMDGFDSSSGVIMMGATNTPEVLDAALLRAGRFDRQVVVDRPDLEGRLAILNVHAQKAKLSLSADLKVIASRTPGMVGADLANLINEAALLAVRRDAAQIEMQDLEEAVDRVMLGLEKKSRVMSQEEKERVAYHEVGHTLVALSVKHAHPVHRVTIIPRGIGALGHTLQLPEKEKYLMTQPELEDQIAVLLGGRVAEELCYEGVVSTGASDDLQRATRIARSMVTQYGMSEKMGHLTYGNISSSRFLFSGVYEEKNYSEETAQSIDNEVKRIIDQQHATVKNLLIQKRAALMGISRELIEKETLSGTDLKELLARF